MYKQSYQTTIPMQTNVKSHNLALTTVSEGNYQHDDHSQHEEPGQLKAQALYI